MPMMTDLELSIRPYAACAFETFVDTCAIRMICAYALRLATPDAGAVQS